MKTLSCNDLHYSVFLAPDRVRTCCKRFFVDGEIRGDVELFVTSENMSSQDLSETILQAKRRLYNEINKGNDTGCSGCPFLVYDEWPVIDELEIRHLSLEYHSICNLKCSYCSDTYYGGRSAQYDVLELVKYLNDNGILKKCRTVAWGGGEPLADKNFSNLLDYLMDNVNAKIRVFTNAVKYSNRLAKHLSQGGVNITTSIDSGTSSTYVKVRGKDRLDVFVKNIKKYSLCGSENIIIKYVFTDDNCSLYEVESFISLVEENGLSDCCFQISCNYYDESISVDKLVSMIMMYGYLETNLNAVVFFDDLLWHRMNATFVDNKLRIMDRLEKYSCANFISENQSIGAVVLWGAGSIGADLIRYAEFFNTVEIEYVVDSNFGSMGDDFYGKKIRSPDTLVEDHFKIVISAAQNYLSILKDFERLGIDKSRIVRGLVI